MSEPAVETEAVLPPMFTALDRCDSCGAQAKARALLATGTLLFCGHHATKYGTALFSAGAAIESEF
jgi:hypothetical protein